MGTAASPIAELLRSGSLAPAERVFVGASVLPWREAQACWQQWLKAPTIPTNGEDLLPLLGARRSLFSPAAPLELNRKMGVSELLEQQRGAALQDILGTLLGQLQPANVQPIVLDGHQRPGRVLRHTACISLLFDGKRNLLAAAKALHLGSEEKCGVSFNWIHPSGLPINMYAVAPPGLATLNHAQLYATAQKGKAGGVSFVHLGGAEELVMAAVSYCRNGQLRWIADAGLLVAGDSLAPDHLRQLARRNPLVTYALGLVLNTLENELALTAAAKLRDALPKRPLSPRQMAQVAMALVGRRSLFSLRQPLLLKARLAWWLLTTR